MIQARNGELLSARRHAKRKGNYTGERLKSLRSETYREVVRLLAEPREHVSIREICRRCHVTDDTVKAIERREAVPIAARKQELMIQAARIAKRAYDRVEDEIDDAPLSQAVVTAGVFTDKIVALSNDPFQVQIAHTIEPSERSWERFQALAAEIERQALEAREARKGAQSTPTQTSAAAQLPAGNTDAIEQRALARRALPESSNES